MIATNDVTDTTEHDHSDQFTVKKCTSTIIITLTTTPPQKRDRNR